MGIKGLFKHLFHYLILATAVLALSACGGGESSSSGEPRIDRQEAEATNLVFVDAQLAGCVEDLIDSQGYTLVEQITELDCSGKEIADVEGIENIFNLQTLDLSNNLITDVAPISQLKNLKQLNLQNNQLEIAAVLTESESLEQIDLTGNNELLCVEQDILNTKYNDNLIKPEACEPEQLTIEQAFADTELLSCVQQTVQQIKAEKEIDVLYPQQLQQLECINQNINSIDGIENLVNLRELNLSQNAIDDMGLLQGLTKLKRVLLSKNQITDIQPLTSSVNMQELRLDSNPLTDTGLSPIQHLKALQLLHISNTDVRDLSPLNELIELLELRANNNRIIDLDSLSQLTKLSSLWVENNQIAKLDTIEQLPNLVHLVISNNWVTDLTPLQNSDKLRWLHLDGTEVQDLTPLSSLTELKWLQLNNSRVEDIQAIYSLNKLDWLHLKGNNSIPCEQLEYMENVLTPERTERPDVESCDQTPQPQSTPISTIEFQDQELRDCVYDAAKEQGAIDTNQLTSLSCSIEEYGEITDIAGLEQLPELQTIDLSQHNNIACIQTEDLKTRFDNQGGYIEEGYVEEGYEGEGPILKLSGNCNTAPIINIQIEQTVLAGEQTTITAQAIDQDEDELTYSWQQTDGEITVELANADTATPSFTAPQQEQILEFTLTVTDEHKLSTTQTINIIVTGALLGSKENPFLVETYDHLKKVGTGEDGWELDSYYLQTADIDASPSKDEDDGKGFIPIGTEEKPFTGGYDGGGFAIDGLTINRKDQFYVGLFSYNIGTIENISVIKSTINGAAWLGGLVGINAGTIFNSYVTGDITSVGYHSHIGGLVGWNQNNAVISDSFAVVKIISAFSGIGGLVGSNDGVVKNSYASGDVTAIEGYIGGLVGFNKGKIENSYARGNVTGNHQVGGLVGQMNHSDAYNETPAAYSSIINSYSTGQVLLQDEDSEPVEFGGLIGASTSDQNKVIESFWDVDTTGMQISAGGEPKTSDELKTIETFNKAEWNFGETWMILSEGYTYPRLAWNTIEVDSWTDLHNMRNNMHANYILTRNLTTDDPDYEEFAGPDANGGQGWEPVGTEENPFMGTFDGKSFTINGIFVSRQEEDFAGLLGFAKNADFFNMGLNGVDIIARTIAGGLAGINSNGTIIKSFVVGDIETIGGAAGGLVGISGGDDGIIVDSHAVVNISADNTAGGLVGSNTYGSTITNSYAIANVVANQSAGCLVGANYNGIITASYATGEAAANSEVGGMAGFDFYGVINNSYVNCDVTGNSQAGGLVGLMQHRSGSQDQYSSITNSYSTGHVSLKNGDLEPIGFGGLVGVSTHELNTVTNSFWDIETSGQETSAGGTGLPTSMMQTRSTFTGVEWDFANIWVMRDYPEFQWDSIAIAEIEFVDSALRQCVLDAAQANDWTQSNQVTNLNCAGLGITDTTGLQQLTDIGNLDLRGNNEILCSQLDSIRSSYPDSELNLPSECIIAPQVTATAISGANGTISPASQILESGTSATFTITPDTGYQIEKITTSGCDGEPLTDNSYTTAALVADCTAYATFNRIKHTLIVSTLGNGWGTVLSESIGIDCGDKCEAIIDQGTTVILIANPDEGSVFVGWSENCMVVEQQCQITLNDAQTVTAEFAIQPPQNVTLDAGDSQIKVSWNTVVGATGYTIYWGTDPGIDPANNESYLDSQVADNSSYTITGLVNNNEYYVVVTTNVGGANESGASAEVSAKCISDLEGVFVHEEVSNIYDISFMDGKYYITDQNNIHVTSEIGVAFTQIEGLSGSFLSTLYSDGDWLYSSNQYGAKRIDRYGTIETYSVRSHYPGGDINQIGDFIIFGESNGSEKGNAWRIYDSKTEFSEENLRFVTDQDVRFVYHGNGSSAILFKDEIYFYGLVGFNPSPGKPSIYSTTVTNLSSLTNSDLSFVDIGIDGIDVRDSQNYSFTLAESNGESLLTVITKNSNYSYTLDGITWVPKEIEEDLTFVGSSRLVNIGANYYALAINKTNNTYHIIEFTNNGENTVALTQLATGNDIGNDSYGISFIKVAVVNGELLAVGKVSNGDDSYGIIQKLDIDR